MNSAFIGCEELYRSRWITPSEISIILHILLSFIHELLINEFSNEKEILTTFKNR